MKIGISTASLWNYETEDALSVLKEVGAETCEVYLRTFYEYRPEFAKKFAANAEGLEINSVHVAPHNFEPQLFFDQRRTRGDGFYWLDQVMRSAQLFGAKKYTFHGFLQRLGNRDYDTTAERLREISDFCARYGVTLCLENVPDATYNSPYVFKELKARCPQLEGTFDIKHARNSNYPWQMYVKDMSGAISHVHLSDVDENGKTCLPGCGLYNFEEIFKTLAGEGFDGAVLIETGSFSDLTELKRSVEFLKEVAQKTV
ncbi:MAG: sugar phosphate isomerase/epimerase [Clostridia bacterium]|nr:sugar phosphate isomerase/epimerase [Clostridia bacterium]